MPIPDYQTLMLASLRLAAHRSPRSIAEATDAFVSEYRLTEAEAAERIPSGSTTVLRSRVHWAVTYLVHAGLLTRPRRGHFAITDAGAEVVKDPPAKIDNAFLANYPSFVEFMARSKPGPRPVAPEAGPAPAAQVVTPEEQLATAYGLLRAEVESDLLERLRKAPPEFFEKAVLGLLRHMGYGAPSDEAVQHLGQPGDEGVDGVIYQDELHLDFIYVQAKRNADGNTVGREQVQAFVGALEGKAGSKGVFFTTSAFSTGAKSYARGVHKQVILIDGSQLTRLMFDRGVGVRTKDQFPVKTVDEGYFEAD